MIDLQVVERDELGQDCELSCAHDIFIAASHECLVRLVLLNRERSVLVSSGAAASDNDCNDRRVQSIEDTIFFSAIFRLSNLGFVLCHSFMSVLGSDVARGRGQ